MKRKLGASGLLFAYSSIEIPTSSTPHGDLSTVSGVGNNMSVEYSSTRGIVSGLKPLQHCSTIGKIFCELSERCDILGQCFFSRVVVIEPASWCLIKLVRFVDVSPRMCMTPEGKVWIAG